MAGRQASRRSNSYTATARHRRRDTFREEIKKIYMCMHERDTKSLAKVWIKKKLYGISLVGAHGNWNQAVACCICPYLLASLLFLFFISNRFLSLDFFFFHFHSLSGVVVCASVFRIPRARTFHSPSISLSLFLCLSSVFVSKYYKFYNKFSYLYYLREYFVWFSWVNAKTNEWTNANISVYL